MKRYLHIPNQRPDEQVSLVLHRHWATFLPNTFVFLCLVLIPAAAAMVAIRTLAGGPIVKSVLTSIPGVFIASLYYLFIGLNYFRNWVDYMLDVCVVTTKRIARLDQRGMFTRIVSELELPRIQDVTVEVKGLFPSLFRYGTIRIQTAAEMPEFFFVGIPKPYDVLRTIMSLQEEELRSLGVAPGVAAKTKSVSPLKDGIIRGT